MQGFGLIAVIASLVLGQAAAAANSSQAEGTGSFTFREIEDLPVTVWYYLPAVRDSSTRVVFLLHGESRTAREARDLAVRYARDRDLILAAPEFDKLHFPGDSYSFGGMVDTAGRIRPRNEWLLLALERIFDDVRHRWQLQTATYDVLGHSAGAQFVHRLVLFVPEARFDRAIASAPGRYAFPSSGTAVPYGMGGTDASSLLKQALQRDFVLLLGDRDTTDRVREVEAMAQGANRLARGLRFFAEATEQASRLQVPLHWHLVINPGADHSPEAAVEATFRLLPDSSEPERRR